MAKTLGILGGLGPAASVYFYQLITEHTKALRDQDHLDIVLFSKASIPDRTDFILGKSANSPLPYMQTSIRKLTGAGAEIIAVPCNTAEYFHSEMQASCPVRVMRTAYESARFAAARGVKRLGILATEGTLLAGIYQNHLASLGVGFALPSQATQKEITRLISDTMKATYRT